MEGVGRKLRERSIGSFHYVFEPIKGLTEYSCLHVRERVSTGLNTVYSTHHMVSSVRAVSDFVS